MNLLFEKLKQELKMKNIHVSHQRLKVLEYITENQCHPTVEQIFTDLQKEISTLSKTTVYNTLNIFTEANIVKAVNIESTESRFDAIPEEHGHFKCRECEKIYDFHVDMDILVENIPSGFQVSEKDVYFKGVCRDCLQKYKNN